MATLIGQTVRPFKTAAYQYVRTTDALPSVEAALAAADPIAKVKLFNPTGIGTWYIAGFDPETGIAYGVATLQETEAGDFDINEIAAFRGRFRLPIERDLYFDPAPLSAILENR